MSAAMILRGVTRRSHKEECGPRAFHNDQTAPSEASHYIYRPHFIGSGNCCTPLLLLHLALWMQRALVLDCVRDARPSDYGQVGTVTVGVAVGHSHHIWCHLTFVANFCTNLLFCHPLSTFTPCFLIFEQSLDWQGWISVSVALCISDDPGG